MRNSVLFASAIAVAFGASTAMAGGVSERALHNLPAIGKSTAQQVHVPMLDKKKGGKSDFAVVNGDGSVARGRGVASVNHLTTGVYIVDFTKDKTGCAYIATVGLGGDTGVSTPGYATVVGANGDATGIFMDTYDSTGANSDTGFHLVTIC